MNIKLSASGSVGEKEVNESLAWGTSSDDSAKPVISLAKLKESLKTSGGAPCEDLNTYLRSKNYSHFNDSGFLSSFTNYIGAAAAKNPEYLRDIFSDYSFANFVKNKFTAGSPSRRIIDALLAFIAAKTPEVLKSTFEGGLLKVFQNSKGDYEPQAKKIKTLEASENGELVKSLSTTAQALGLDKELEATTKGIYDGTRKVHSEARGSAEKFISFDMRNLRGVLDQDTGNVLNREGEPLLLSARISDDIITKMGFTPGSEDCPVKAGTINWHSVVEKARNIAITGNKDKLADYLQETFATYVSYCRVRMNDATDIESKEAWKQMSNNVKEVFVDGAGGMPEYVLNMVKSAFEHKPYTSEKVARILSGNATETKGNSIIESINSHIKEETTDAKLPVYEASKAAVSGTPILAQLLTGSVMSVLDPADLTKKDVTITRKDASDNATKMSFGQASTAYEKSLKAMASSIRTTVVTDLFKGTRTVDPTDINAFRTKYKEKSAKVITDIEKAINTQDKFDVATLFANRELTKLIEGKTIKRDDLDREKAGEIAKSFVVELARKVTDDKQLDEGKLVKLFSTQIDNLKDALEGDDKTKVATLFTNPGGIMDQLLNNKIDIVPGTKDFKLTADTTKTETRRKNFIELIEKKDFMRMSLHDKVLAEPKTADAFSKIAFDEIPNIISDNEALKEALMKHAPAAFEGRFEDAKAEPMKAGHRFFALFGKLPTKDESVANAVRLSAFLDLLNDAKLSSEAKYEVVNTLLRSHITGEGDDRKRNINTLIGRLDTFIAKTNFEVKGSGSSATAVNVGGIAGLDEVLGMTAMRSALLKEANSHVVSGEARISVDRVSKFINTLTGKNLGDLATGSLDISQGARNIFDAAPADSAGLANEIDKLNDGTKLNFTKFLGLDSDAKGFGLNDATGKLEGDHVPSLIESTMAFFKGLANRFKLLAFSSESATTPSSVASKEPTEASKPSTAVPA